MFAVRKSQQVELAN